jgi:hypothetical protein
MKELRKSHKIKETDGRREELSATVAIALTGKREEVVILLVCSVSAFSVL